MRYFLIGFMGSGKTYWANQWGSAFQLPVYDLDEEIEKFTGKSVAAIFKEDGEDVFRKVEKKVLYSFFNRDGFILSCGGGTPCFFHNMKEMNKKGVTIYLKSTPLQLAQRLHSEKETRPLIKDIPDDMMESFIAQKLNSRKEWYAQAMYHLPVEYINNSNFDRIKYRHER
ncbi:MAG: shikimate kinase [Chitinophagaceae bacterium]|nr:shikimate kinase [Chitinophagaceae bacterium]